MGSPVLGRAGGYELLFCVFSITAGGAAAPFRYPLRHSGVLVAYIAEFCI